MIIQKKKFTLKTHYLLLLNTSNPIDKSYSSLSLCLNIFILYYTKIVRNIKLDREQLYKYICTQFDLTNYNYTVLFCFFFLFCIICVRCEAECVVCMHKYFGVVFESFCFAIDKLYSQKKKI